jgi:hypothetical protein
MSEEWKKQDRPCPPCPDCGVELYEKFWGNGGWVGSDKDTDKAHEALDCVRVLSAKVDRMKSALAWYVDVGEGAAKEPPALPSQGAAYGMLQHDGGKRAREALEIG